MTQTCCMCFKHDYFSILHGVSRYILHSFTQVWPPEVAKMSRSISFYCHWGVSLSPAHWPCVLMCVQGLSVCPEDESMILTSFYSTIADLSVKQGTHVHVLTCLTSDYVSRCCCWCCWYIHQSIGDCTLLVQLI